MSFKPIKNVLFAGVLLSSLHCGNKENANDDASSATGLTGAQLYTNNCQPCHGALVSSTKRGKTESEISNAISSQAEMASLQGKFTDAQLVLIAVALVE